MTVPTHLSQVVAAVMGRVTAEDATVTWELSQSALPKHGAPPRMIWVPTRDRFTAAQKRPGPHSVMTVMAGFSVTLWGTSIDAVETLRERLCRALRAVLGDEPFREATAGAWVADIGATTLGAAYVLTSSVAMDVPRAAAAPATATPTSVTLDTTRSTTGDGFTDAGEGT